MKLRPYLTFNGDAAEAFERYAEIFGGDFAFRLNFGQSQFASRMPPETHEKVMNARLRIGKSMLMASDNHQGNYARPSGMSLSVQVPELDEAKRVFEALAEGGTVRMPFEKTFWADGFGMVVDRFGIPWMVNCEQLQP